MPPTQSQPRSFSKKTASSSNVSGASRHSFVWLTIALAVLLAVIAYKLLFDDKPIQLYAFAAVDYAHPVLPNGWAIEDREALYAVSGNKSKFEDQGQYKRDLQKGIQEFLETASAELSSNPLKSTPQVPIIYISGHGYIDEVGEPVLLLPNSVDESSPDAAGSSVALDGTPFNPDGSIQDHCSISIQSIVESIDQHPKIASTHAILMLDATKFLQHWPTGVTQNDFCTSVDQTWDKYQWSKGRVGIVLCSDAGQYSQLAPERGGTVFGTFVAECFAGAGNVNERDGGLTANELQTFLTEKIEGWTRNHRGDVQSPVFLFPESFTPDTVICSTEESNRWTAKPKSLPRSGAVDRVAAEIKEVFEKNFDQLAHSRPIAVAKVLDSYAALERMWMGGEFYGPDSRRFQLQLQLVRTLLTDCTPPARREIPFVGVNIARSRITNEQRKAATKWLASALRDPSSPEPGSEVASTEQDEAVVAAEVPENNESTIPSSEPNDPNVASNPPDEANQEDLPAPTYPAAIDAAWNMMVSANEPLDTTAIDKLCIALQALPKQRVVKEEFLLRMLRNFVTIELDAPHIRAICKCFSEIEQDSSPADLRTLEYVRANLAAIDDDFRSDILDEVIAEGIAMNVGNTLSQAEELHREIRSKEERLARFDRSCTTLRWVFEMQAHCPDFSLFEDLISRDAEGQSIITPLLPSHSYARFRERVFQDLWLPDLWNDYRLNAEEFPRKYSMETAGNIRTIIAMLQNPLPFQGRAEVRKRLVEHCNQGQPPSLSQALDRTNLTGDRGEFAHAFLGLATTKDSNDNANAPPVSQVAVRRVLIGNATSSSNPEDAEKDLWKRAWQTRSMSSFMTSLPLSREIPPHANDSTIDQYSEVLFADFRSFQTQRILEDYWGDAITGTHFFAQAATALDETLDVQPMISAIQTWKPLEGIPFDRSVTTEEMLPTRFRMMARPESVPVRKARLNLYVNSQMKREGPQDLPEAEEEKVLLEAPAQANVRAQLLFRGHEKVASVLNRVVTLRQSTEFSPQDLSAKIVVEEPKVERKLNVLFLVDCSGTMADSELTNADGSANVSLARESIERVVTTLRRHPDWNASVGIMRFGHRHYWKKNADGGYAYVKAPDLAALHPADDIQEVDTVTLESVDDVNLQQLQALVCSRGESPVYQSLNSALEVLQGYNDPESKQILIVLSDGIHQRSVGPVTLEDGRTIDRQKEVVTVKEINGQGNQNTSVYMWENIQAGSELASHLRGEGLDVKFSYNFSDELEREFAKYAWRVEIGNRIEPVGQPLQVSPDQWPGDTRIDLNLANDLERFPSEPLAIEGGEVIRLSLDEIDRQLVPSQDINGFAPFGRTNGLDVSLRVQDNPMQEARVFHFVFRKSQTNRLVPPPKHCRFEIQDSGGKTIAYFLDRSVGTELPVSYLQFQVPDRLIGERAENLVLRWSDQDDALASFSIVDSTTSFEQSGNKVDLSFSVHAGRVLVEERCPKPDYEPLQLALENRLDNQQPSSVRRQFYVDDQGQLDTIITEFEIGNMRDTSGLRVNILDHRDWARREEQYDAVAAP